MQLMHTLFVYDEELRWDIQGYSLCLLETNYNGATVAI